jgi:hypothetical protein
MAGYPTFAIEHMMDGMALFALLPLITPPATADQVARPTSVAA